MWVVRLFTFFLFIAVLVVPAWWSLRKYLPQRWQPTVKRALTLNLIVFLSALSIYGLGRFYDISTFRHGSAPIFTTLLVGTFILTLTSVWPWFLNRRIRKGASTGFDPSRRQFLERAALLGPAGAITLSPTGTAMAYSQPLLRNISIWDESWDSRLEGLKILQFTDVHLGLLIDTQQIQAIASQLQPGEVDIIVLTGDIADDLSMLDPAFDIIDAMKPRLGVFSSMGNHEIYRGRGEAESIYTRRSTYLNNNGQRLEYNGVGLWIGGVDDPARLFKRRDVFFRESVERAVAERPEDVGATILLSHRPDAFIAAAKQKCFVDALRTYPWRTSSTLWALNLRAVTSA